ncbi:MAG TPA: glutamate--tRNA ligase, partial [Gudongella oleilytica]|nr:glutamate--tRNA ligase [Gudongella oleilytica]
IKAELEKIDMIDMEYAKGFMKLIQGATGIKGKNLFMPVRVALTGSAHGPELVNVLYLLGKDRIISRADAILNR